MQEVNFTFAQPMKISVNGEIFDMILNDADVYERAVAVRERYKGITKESGVESIIAAVREVSAVVDSILGEGAMQRISGGRPVCMADALQVMLLILDAAAKSYAEKLESYE